MPFSFKTIEQELEKLLGFIAPAIEADPNAQAALGSTKKAIADAKTTVVTAASNVAASAVEKELTPTLGSEGAIIAAQIAQDAITAGAEKIAAKL